MISGTSVSLSADGTTVAIGAPYNDSNGSSAGHVHIYQRNSNSDWEQLGAGIDGEAGGDYSDVSFRLTAARSLLVLTTTVPAMYAFISAIRTAIGASRH